MVKSLIRSRHRQHASHVPDLFYLTFQLIHNILSNEVFTRIAAPSFLGFFAFVDGTESHKCCSRWYMFSPSKQNQTATATCQPAKCASMKKPIPPNINRSIFSVVVVFIPYSLTSPLAAVMARLIESIVCFLAIRKPTVNARSNKHSVPTT